MMVYLAYCEKDAFWKKNSSKFFSAKFGNIIGKIWGNRGPVYIRETNIADRENGNVLYYTGHGINRNGIPQALMKGWKELPGFITGHGLKLDRITFLSCHTFLWIRENYGAFLPILEQNPQDLQIEGSEETISSVHIHNIIAAREPPSSKSGRDKKNSCFAPLKCVRMSFHKGTLLPGPRKGIRVAISGQLQYGYEESTEDFRGRTVYITKPRELLPKRTWFGEI